MFSLFNPGKPLQKVWSHNLDNPVYRGLHPVADPFDEDMFYVGDGWGSSYPSMKIRKFALGSGAAIQSTYTKNAVRCLGFESNGQDVFAVMDNRILQLDRHSLEVKKKFDKGIQKYGDYIGSNDNDTLLIMNYKMESLFVFDHKKGTGTRKKIGSCCGISRRSQNEFLIFDNFHGRIVSYDIASSTTTEILKTDVFHSAQFIDESTVCLRLGRLHTDEVGVVSVRPTGTLRILSLDGVQKQKDLEIRQDFVTFSIHGNIICLAGLNSFYSCSVIERKVVSTYSVGKDEIILKVLYNKGKVLTQEDHNNDKLVSLNCYSFHAD